MKFKLYKQRDGMQCGIACLAMICHYYNDSYRYEHVERKCGGTKEGVSLKAIYDTAIELGLNVKPGRLSVQQLVQIEFPCILHWNQNHFVVLYKIDRKGERFWIADPGRGKYRLSREEFEEHWISINSMGKEMGVALFLWPGEEFGNIEQENITGRFALSFIWGYVVKYKAFFLQILFSIFLGCVFQLSIPFLTQWIVDIGVKHSDVSFVWLILIGEMMIVVGRTATEFLRSRIILHISMRINIELVSDFLIKLMKLPMAFFDTKLEGDLIQRMGDHGRIQSFMTNQILGLLFTVLSFLVYGLVLLIYSKIAFTVFVVGSMLYGLWIARFLSKRKILDYEMFEKQSMNQDYTIQIVSSMQEIKLQDCEKRRRWEWEDTQVGLFNIQQKLLHLQQKQEAGGVFINEIKNMLITVIAASAVINGEITLGAMLAIQYIVGQLNSPIDQMMRFIYAMQDVKISMERVCEIHGMEDEYGLDNKIMCLPHGRTIEIDNVSFRYDKHALKDTISDISFVIPEGKVTAIVGASGSGKSTLIKLMLGYYPANEGVIKISDEDIKNYDLKWWRRQCGVVMQDGVIFSESIMRNIAVDDNDINVERVIEAAKTACVHDFIVSLPLGYDTKLGKDGVDMSKGQKQRILIARAVYKNPDFIFLDEATNSLDAKNEKNIVENLDRFYNGKTVVVVAHRLSTVKNAHQIIVIDDGKIVEMGTHSELVVQNGVYRNLVENQLELGE